MSVLSSSAPPRGLAGEGFGNLVIIFFLLTQVLDGALTYVGVSAVGLTEGNPLIAHFMDRHGAGPSLTAAKALAVACSVALHLLGLHRTLAVLTLFYLAVAVLPWTYLLFVAH